MRFHHFVMMSALVGVTTDLGFRILTAYQFRGSDHAHQVLTPREAAPSHTVH